MTTYLWTAAGWFVLALALSAIAAVISWMSSQDYSKALSPLEELFAPRWMKEELVWRSFGINLYFAIISFVIANFVQNPGLPSIIAVLLCLFFCLWYGSVMKNRGVLLGRKDIPRVAVQMLILIVLVLISVFVCRPPATGKPAPSSQTAGENSAKGHL